MIGYTPPHLRTAQATKELQVSPQKSVLRGRPRTCPPRVHHRATSPTKPTQVTDKPGGSLVTTTFVTKKGYQVHSTQLYASDSKKTLQLVQTVRSPSHEHRLRMIRMK